jgi:hypothetical protein
MATNENPTSQINNDNNSSSNNQNNVRSVLCLKLKVIILSFEII